MASALDNGFSAVNGPPNPHPSTADEKVLTPRAEAILTTPSRPSPIPFLDRLRQIPQKRPIPWQEGKELPPEKSTDSPRVQQRGACLLATRGNIVEKPCDHCFAGHGRFTACITLDQWFQGACSSCIFTSKGNKCSLRVESIGKVDGRALRHKLDVDGSPVAESSEGPKRRKRNSAPSKLKEAKGSDLDAMLQSQIANDLSAPPRTQPSQASKRGHQPSHSVPGFLVASSPKIGSASSQSQTHVYPRPPSAAVARKEVPFDPVHHITKDHVAAENKPSIPLVPAHEPTTYLIHTFPAAKQRQIRQLVNGLQGGIDHLRKQLKATRTSLGIEPEPPRDPT